MLQKFSFFFFFSSFREIRESIDNSHPVKIHQTTHYILLFGIIVENHISFYNVKVHKTVNINLILKEMHRYSLRLLDLVELENGRQLA